jgi:hypothetical protein
MISALSFIIICGFFREIFFLRSPQRSLMCLNGDYSGVSSVYMQNDQEIGLRWHASWKRHAESSKQHLLCVIWLHPAWTTEFVMANLWQEGEAQKYCATCKSSAHCSLSLQRKLVIAVHDLRWWPTL